MGEDSSLDQRRRGRQPRRGQALDLADAHVLRAQCPADLLHSRFQTDAAAEEQVGGEAVVQGDALQRDQVADERSRRSEGRVVSSVTFVRGGNARRARSRGGDGVRASPVGRPCTLRLERPPAGQPPTWGNPDRVSAETHTPPVLAPRVVPAQVAHGSACRPHDHAPCALGGSGQRFDPTMIRATPPMIATIPMIGGSGMVSVSSS